MLPAALFGVCLLVVGLWPFSFHAANRVRILADGGGLKFDAPEKHSRRDLGGLVFSPNPLACREKNQCAPGTLSIAIVLGADGDARSCVKRIVELRRPDGSEALYLGQWKTSLIVRSFAAPSATGKPYREIGIGGVLAPGGMHSVSIVSGSRGTRAYVDGRLTKQDPGFRLLRETQTLAGHKAYLGNSPDLSCPWEGRVQSVALFGIAWETAEGTGRPESEPRGIFQCGGGEGLASACYRFDRANDGTISDLSLSGNDLRKPERLVFDKPFLVRPDSHYISVPEVMMNLLGFVPLGFLTCLCLRGGPRRPFWRCLAVAAGVGCALSLAIELGQVWLPDRVSSLMDLVANTVGSSMGGMLTALQRRI